MSDRFESYENTLRNTLSESKTALSNKGVSVPEETKLRNVPALIGEIKTGSQVELVITAPDYEGMELTASKGEKHVNGTVTEGIAKIPVDEEGTWKVSAWDGNSIEIETDMTFEGELTSSKVYTIRINKNEADPTNRVEYMDDAVGLEPITVQGGVVNYNGWDERFPLKKNYPVMLNQDGSLAYKLNPNDYSKQENGNASGIADINSERNAFSCVEKMYTKFWSDSTYEYMSITDKPKDGYSALGFIDEKGNEMDCFYLGMFEGSWDNSSHFRSISGQKVKVPTDIKSTTYDIRTGATAQGANYGLGTWAMYQVLDLAFNIMFKTEDCTKLGQGRKGGGENVNSLGSLPNLQTGILNDKGSIAVDSASGCVKFMHIEDYFSNRSQPLAEMIDGCVITFKSQNNGTLHVKSHRPYNAIGNDGGVQTSGYTNESSFLGTTGNIKNSVLSNDYGRVPATGGGTSSTFECDELFYDSSKYMITSPKAGCRRGGIRGLESSWFCCLDYVVTNGNFRGSCCARLSYEPQTT